MRKKESVLTQPLWHSSVKLASCVGAEIDCSEEIARWVNGILQSKTRTLLFRVKLGDFRLVFGSFICLMKYPNQHIIHIIEMHVYKCK